MPYDLEGARAAGLSDADISRALASRVNYDLEGAQKAGIPDAEIATTLTKKYNEGFPQPAAQPPGLRPGKAMLDRADLLKKEAMDTVLMRDPGVNYEKGVQDFALRSGFSNMATDTERAGFLDKMVGQGNYGRDKYGRYYIKPEGLAKRGIKSDIPLSLEEPGITRYDVADVVGSLPALAGATGAALMASGAGFVPGVAATALGAGAGTALRDLIKRGEGLNQQSADEQAGTILKDVAGGAIGEGVGRAAIGTGRFLMNPYGRFANPERQALTREALDAGLTPRVFQFQPGGGLLSRFQSMGEQVLNPHSGANKIDVSNKAALEKSMEALKSKAGAPQPNNGEQLIAGVKGFTEKLLQESNAARQQAQAGLDQSLSNIQRNFGSPDPNVGQVVQDQIRAARSKFGSDASQLYSKVDELVGGKPIVPTRAVKDQLDEFMKNLPTDAGGNKIFPTPEMKSFFAKYGNLGEFQTTAQMQQLRTDFRNAAESTNLVPGVDKYRARLLRQSVDQAFEDATQGGIQRITSPIVDSQGREIVTNVPIDSGKANAAVNLLRQADEFYKTGIRKFDTPAIAALTRDASQTGAVEPARVVDTIIRPGYTAAATRVKNLVAPDVWKKVQSEHLSGLITDSTRLIDGQETISGAALFNKIKNAGKTFDVVYGKDAPAIRKFASELAARDGKLDPSVLKGDIAQNLQIAATKQKQLDDFLSQNYLAQLGKPGQEATQAADFIFRPNSPLRIKTAKAFYGENSPEFKGLQDRAMTKILDDFVEPGKDPLVQVFNGEKLTNTLNKYGRQTLEETFGKETTNDLYNFARVSQFVTQKNPHSGSIVSATVALAPLRHVWKIVDLFGTSYLLRQPGAIKWLSEGIQPGNKAAAAGAITRLGSLAASLVREKTSAGSIDLSAPNVDQQQ